MIASWFWLAIGMLTLGAMFESAYHGNLKMMLISFAYALADFVLATVDQ